MKAPTIDGSRRDDVETTTMTKKKIDCCLNCSKSQKDDGGQLLVCSQCKVAKYCSVECQKVGWKAHKKWCKLAKEIPVDSEMLLPDTTNFLNMNKVLSYAGGFMEDLKHVHIRVDNEQLLDTYKSGGMFEFKMDWKYIQDFLQKGPRLSGFGIYFARRYSHIACAITNGGRALLPISQQKLLHTLYLESLHFYRPIDFQIVLSGHASGQSLKFLEISGLSFGGSGAYGKPSIWSLEEAKFVAHVIKQLNTLECLKFGDMEDENLKGREEDVLAPMLTNKPNLRYFGCNMVAPYEAKMYGRNINGCFNDRSIDVIVEKVGHTLQQLVLYNQSDISVHGLRTILLGCPHLRKLDLGGIHFTPDELLEVLPLTSTLVYFIFGHVPPYYDDKIEKNFNRWMPVVVATKGKTIIQPGRNIVPVDAGDDVSLECIENYKKSQKLIDQSNDRYRDNECTNIWDFLL